jgi:EamA domain-containing membrane protein RarD
VTAAWASIACYWIGEFSGIIALIPVLVLRVNRAAHFDEIRRHKHHLVLPALGAVAGLGLAFALASARDVRLSIRSFFRSTAARLRDSSRRIP